MSKTRDCDPPQSGEMFIETPSRFPFSAMSKMQCSLLITKTKHMTSETINIPHPRRGPRPGTILIAILIAMPAGVHAQAKVTIAHNDNKTANAEFKFSNVPSPSRDDAAAHAHVMVVDGEAAA